MVEIEGRSVLTKFIILPKAKGNRTLLETDFLSSSGLVLDLKNTCWYFWDNPTHKYPFGEELDTPSIVEKMSSNTCQLKEGEGESLTSAQKEKLNLLFESFQNVFEPWGEALAVVWALNKFRGYIDRASITVASDHQPLRWLMKLKSSTGRLARRALQLQSFNLNMEYIPGKSNVVADMLSRLACHEEIELCEVCTVAIDVPSRYAPDSESEEAQLVVPSHERTLILKNHHDAPMAGHYEGTYTRIAKNHYWTGMRKYITDYVKNCPDCIKYKASNQKPSGLLQTPVQAQRFETLAIDLIGPLPESKDGSSSLRTVPPSGSNCLHYPMPQLNNVPLP
ncbi:transposon Ty3-I Gag-Pol polyprotein [Trichonephila clavipes]|nr:transposon Ty3-I Gag-Pol polyprotein [Trichonephila clavipes]